MHFALLCQEQYATYNTFKTFIYLFIIIQHYAVYLSSGALRFTKNLLSYKSTFAYNSFHKEQEIYSVQVHCGIPPYREQYTTFISHHLYWNLKPLQVYNTTPDWEQYTLYSTSSPRIRIYHIFSSVLAFGRNTVYCP